MKYSGFIVVFFMVIGCSSKLSTQKEELHHVVLVWFEKTMNEKQKNEVIKQSKTLARMKEVKHLHIGKAVYSSRSGAKDGFDLGMTFTFSSPKNRQKYLQKFSHTNFINKYIRGKVAKVEMFDY